MKYAIDRFVGDKDGKEMEVSASDIYDLYGGGYVPRSKDRFYCPECQEKVYWRRRGGQLPDVFYHQNKTDFSPECDKRVDGRSDLYIYERTGLPLYLCCNYGDVYTLNIAFPALGSQLLQKAFSDGITVSICGNQEIPLTPSRFYADEATLLPVTYVPSAGKNYSIVLSGGYAASAIRKKWSDYADGFTYEGAIFSIHNGYAKKIRRGDSITLNKEYYLVSRNFRPFYSEIEYRKIGKIRLNNVDYGVYRFSINTTVESNRFSAISNYFHDAFKVWLLEKAATITPLWPPTIERGDHVMFTPSTSLFCDIESGNESPKAYSYSGKDVRTITVDADEKDNKTIKIGVYAYEPTVLSVDRKYTGREISIRKATLPEVKASHEYSAIGTNEEMLGSVVDSADILNGVKVVSNTKFSVILQTHNHICRVLNIENAETDIEAYKGLSQILFAYGSAAYGYVIIDSINVRFSTYFAEINEQQIISNMKKYMSGEMVAAPLWIQNTAYLLQTKELYVASKYLVSNITNGKIYRTAIPYLHQLRRMLK